MNSPLAAALAQAYAATPTQVFHGSPQPGLQAILANPPRRQFDNATSALGAFFAPSAQGAARYAGESGQIYPVNLTLQKPYEMTPREFLKFQAINRGSDGIAIPAERWTARAAELKQEAIQLRADLEAAGHDGIVIRNTKGQPIEITSFRDVPVASGRAL